MKTEHRLAEALKNLMTQVPLDEISVTTLTKACHLNRQSFYYHFHDIYDLLTLVFLDEKIPALDKVKNLREMVTEIFAYYNKNKAFIDATIYSAGKDLFQEFIYNKTYLTILRFVNENYLSKSLHINDRKSIARFYSLGYGYSIVYYLSTYKNKTLEGLLNTVSFISDENIGKSMQNMAEMKK